MYCIFCKNDSTTSVSVEHIIPESLGNKTHKLPRGVVCDKCNNYFARKIEKPLLDSDYFVQSRVWSFLPSKRGRVPSIENAMVVAPSPIRLCVSRGKEGESYIYPADENSLKAFVEHLRTQHQFSLIYPVPAPVDHYLMARFLAKVGLEVLAHKVMSVAGWEADVTFKPELDEVRHFARYGDTNKYWPFTKEIYMSLSL